MFLHNLLGMGLDMKLYEVPRQSYIKLVHIPSITFPEDTFYFDHIGGMYSYCMSKNGGIFHLPASMEVDMITKPKDWDG